MVLAVGSHIFSGSSGDAGGHPGTRANDQRNDQCDEPFRRLNPSRMDPLSASGYRTWLVVTIVDQGPGGTSASSTNLQSTTPESPFSSG